MDEDKTDDALDIVAELIHQMGRIDVLRPINCKEKTQRPYLKLLDHPAYKAALERRKNHGHK